MVKRTALPDVLTDAALNKFITGVLLDGRIEGDGLAATMGNTLIERTVTQLRAFCPEAYEVATVAAERPPNWPDRIGA